MQVTWDRGAVEEVMAAVQGPLKDRDNAQYPDFFSFQDDLVNEQRQQPPLALEVVLEPIQILGPDGKQVPEPL